jgi:predicted nucleic acid-binding protein
MKIIFDTSAWIEYFLDAKNADMVEEFLSNSEIITPSIVLLELSYRADKEKWNIKEVLSFIKIKSEIKGINEDLILNFGKLYNETKNRVKNISLADCIILATAKLENCRILTCDKHFSIYENSIIIK